MVEPVSREDELVVLVDANDREIGTETKARAHDYPGMLHRAFSLFVFNSTGEVLLQQRASQKRLWPGIWANACCSHPRVGEGYVEAASRRAKEELGLEVAPKELFRFEYRADYQRLGTEHELCTVLSAICDDAPKPHPEEIASTRYVSPDALTEALAQDPDAYSPWLELEWERLRRHDVLETPIGSHGKLSSSSTN